MMPEPKKTKNECMNLGGEIFDIRETELGVDPNQYNDAKAIWYLLAVIAGINGANVRTDVAGPIDKAHAEQLLNDLLNISDQKSKDVVAKICCKLHMQICGHCACH
jgi:hypothetical protein